MKKLLALALVLVACGGGGRTDAQKAEAMVANIKAESSSADWYEAIAGGDVGGLDVAVKDSRFIVATRYGTDAASRERALLMCNAIALYSFDDNAKPIGINEVVVISGQTEIARCST